MSLMTDAQIARFWSKIRVLGEDECWIWTAHLDAQGYGRFWLNGKSWLAHRLAYLLANGVIPEGLQINHRCNNPPCCNPRHLKHGTQQDNMNDMVNAERQARGETHGRTELTEAQVVKIRDLYASGDCTQADLAERFGVTGGTISQTITGETWAHIDGAGKPWDGTRAKGERNAAAKLTEDDVRTIRRLYAQGGYSYRALGRRYGVGFTTIRQAVKRQTWTHI